MALPFVPRPYQLPAIESGIAFARSAKPGDRQLWYGPTGTGKSYVALAWLEALSDYYLIVPNVEIMRDMLAKLGVRCDSQQEVVFVGREQRIFTPVRLRNLMLTGELPAPAGLIVDEAHHNTDDGTVSEQLDALTGNAPQLGITATPFRGTPQGTGELRKRWGTPKCIISLRDAISAGAWNLPMCETWPLVNDDLIEVENGQLVASQVESHTTDKIDDLVSRMLSAGLWITDCIPDGERDGFVVFSRPTAQPTIITMPGTATAEKMYTALRDAALACSLITQGTTPDARREALERINTHAIIQIRTIGEGVDVHARVMVDAAPTLSPVLWLQRFGRLTRPGGQSRYICTNLNYSRHCYLLEGCAPEVYLRDSVQAFGGLSERSAYRAFGLESLGRLKATRVKTTGGYEVHTYGVTQTVGTVRTEYFVIVHPNMPRPYWFSKSSRSDGETMTWGEWTLSQPPEKLSGFRSARPSPLSEKQRRWWDRAAPEHNLQPDQQVNARVFSILPILAKYKVKL